MRPDLYLPSIIINTTNATGPPIASPTPVASGGFRARKQVARISQHEAAAKATKAMQKAGAEPRDADTTQGRLKDGSF